MRILLFSLIFIASACASGQSPYKQGNIVEDFRIQHILNHLSPESTFNSLKKNLTIIDFFGTWCAPCIRSLPHLEMLHDKFGDRLAVILVSTESSTQLNKFIQKQQKLSFPVVVDSNKYIFNLFKPASYPYTIVTDQNNKILSVTESSEITEEKITNWFTERSSAPPIVINTETTVIIKPMQEVKSHAGNNNYINELAEQFIYAAKTGNETALLSSQLKTLNFESFTAKLVSDDDKKAFWINIYNGYTQLLLKKDPRKYSNRNSFFKAKQIEIAGKKFSLDNIEHDILRRSKIKWSLGYLNKVFPGKINKVLRVRKLDYRIHFALNCGAKSCPPIAFYQSANIQDQLDIASRSYLTSESVYNTEKNTLQLPAILGWFRRDFKGKKGMRSIVKKYNIIPADKNPDISFKKYNWDLFLNNYNN